MKWGWKYKICLYKPFCQIFPGAGVVETDMRVGQCRGAVRVKKLIHIFYSNIPTSLANFIFSLQANAGCLNSINFSLSDFELMSLSCVYVSSGRRWLLPICVTHTCERYWSRFLAVLNKTLHHPLTQYTSAPAEIYKNFLKFENSNMKWFYLATISC